ncbi:patatin-like protein [Crossiella sp. CA-258035]|uniref:patatin-like protein n=1 Tax=Crossiella sp. CA-258035 TaxID=2981138 RepID=UPI0024BD1434|nr:patatin-like protein [Crossiella sp. CA-258035]WHT18574.1 patatin-like protein [Crossiella sp. CA-258035]
MGPLDPAAGTAASEPGHNRQELRLALSMRGGVSLAVWIGGAASEIARLRCALAADDPGNPWAGLAGLAGYESVRIDVLTGASAGGLNSAIMAASLVYGFRFDAIRDLWVQLGDLDAMCRATPTMLQAKPPSLLEGDGYFGKELRQRLQKLVAEPARGPLADRVDLLLTATLLDPITVTRWDDRLATIRERRRSAAFRFRHRGCAGDPLSDFAAGTEARRTAAQLAQAARTTSSFPLAFEPASVRAQPDTPSGEVDLIGCFSETAPAGGRAFQVIDGGVLDNIPVGAAIKAIAASPADGPTERWLVYLNPEPIVGTTAKPVSQRRRGLPVGLAALAARYNQESLLTDIEELDAHNREVRRIELRRRALFAPLTALPAAERGTGLTELVRRVGPAHAHLRACLDAERITVALLDPAKRPPGLLRRAPLHDDPVAGWSPQARRSLAPRLTEVLAAAAAADPETVFADVTALGAAVDLCIRWARELELWADEAYLPAIGEVKAVLYRLRQIADVLADHADGRWPALAEAEPGEPTDLRAWVGTTFEEYRQAQRELGPGVSEPLGWVLEAALTPDPGDEREQVEANKRFQERLLELAEALEADGVEEREQDLEPRAVDALGLAWPAVYTAATRLAEAAPRRPRSTETDLDAVVHQLLETAPDLPITLAQVVALTAPLHAAQSAGGRIRFMRIASDAPTPIEFRELLAGKETLSPDDKLCGTDLGAFAAFCSAKWRANDWMWGRLDAAASLVSLLTDPARLREFARGRELDELFADIERIATTPPGPAELGTENPVADKEWRRFLGRRFETRREAVRAELAEVLAPNPVPPALRETRAALTERVQWAVVAAEMSFVDSVELGANPGSPEPAAPVPPGALEKKVAEYQVGHQEIRDLGDVRMARTAIRLGLLAHRTIKPESCTVPMVAARAAMSALKPLLLAVLFFVTAPERALLTTSVALAGLLTAHRPDDWADIPWWTRVGPTVWDFGRWALVVATVLVIFLAARAAVRAVRRKSSGGVRRPAALAGLGVLVGAGGLYAASAGLSFGPAAVTVGAALTTWLATCWMRVDRRVLAALLSAAVFAGGALLFADYGLPIGWWFTSCAVVATYAVTALASLTDTLPERRPHEFSR